MNGKVKWFSREKGYGFIYGDDNLDRFFGVRDIVGPDLPNIGDVVTFEPYQAEGEARASTICITESGNLGISKVPIDEIVECPHCHKHVQPRIVTWRGFSDKTLCPRCGETIKDFLSKFERCWRIIFSG